MANFAGFGSDAASAGGDLALAISQSNRAGNIATTCK